MFLDGCFVTTHRLPIQRKDHPPNSYRPLLIGTDLEYSEMEKLRDSEKYYDVNSLRCTVVPGGYKRRWPY